MAKPLLSLCVIARNEADNIARCLKSVGSLADEIIVVDTGSTDDTAEIGQKLGAKVYFQKWQENFALAKNYALAQARGEWILLMDADDELSKDTRKEIPGLLKAKDTDGFLFQTVNLLISGGRAAKVANLQVRLVRNSPEFRFQGAVHERILGQKGARVKALPLQVYHYGYLDADRVKDKIHRNLKILHRELGKTPDDLYLLFNLGVEYLRANQNGKALACLEKVWQNAAPDAGYLPEAVRKLAFACLVTVNLQRGLSVLARAVQIFPDYTDLYYWQGVIHHTAGEYQDAVRAWQKCLSLGEAPFTYPAELGTGSFLAWQALGDAASEQCDYLEAERCYLQALALSPERQEILEAALRAALHHRDRDEMRQLVHGQFFLDDPNALIRLAAALLEVCELSIAREIMDSITGQEKEENLWGYAQGILLFKSGCFEQAARCFAGIAKAGLYYADALSYGCIIDWLQGKITDGSGKLQRLSDCPGQKTRAALLALVLHAVYSDQAFSAPDEWEAGKVTAEMLSILDVLAFTKQEAWLNAAINVLQLVSCEGAVLLQGAAIILERGNPAAALKFLQQISCPPAITWRYLLLKARCHLALEQWQQAWANACQCRQLAPQVLAARLVMLRSLAGAAQLVLPGAVDEPNPVVQENLQLLGREVL